ncbi:unnamed protein product [Larinioides sclopetarius]|uniref:Uncharacterized protein n=1 Tax=Larinioides sclopetarius TaxID=280406 RepID=A0AAV2B679_9ARAC
MTRYLKKDVKKAQLDLVLKLQEKFEILKSDYYKNANETEFSEAEVALDSIEEDLQNLEIFQSVRIDLYKNNYEGKSGEAQDEAIYNALNEWDIADEAIGMNFDTMSANTVKDKGEAQDEAIYNALNEWDIADEAIGMNFDTMSANTVKDKDLWILPSVPKRKPYVTKVPIELMSKGFSIM